MRRTRPSSRARRRVSVLVAAPLALIALVACGEDGGVSVADSFENIVDGSVEDTVTDDSVGDSVPGSTPDSVSDSVADTVADTVPPEDTEPPVFTFPKPTSVDTVPDEPDTTFSTPTLPPVTSGSPDTPGTLTPAPEYESFVEIFDDTGLISVTVPEAWTDIDGASVVYGDDGESSPALEASPDLERYRTHWDTPGMRFTASAVLAGSDPDELIDTRRPTDCDSDGSQPYDDSVFVGRIEVFTDCGAIGATFYVIGATSNDGQAGVIVSVQAVTTADVTAFEKIQTTFNIHS